jgi:hypothetical protein
MWTKDLTPDELDLLEKHLGLAALTSDWTIAMIIRRLLVQLERKQEKECIEV